MSVAEVVMGKNARAHLSALVGKAPLAPPGLLCVPVKQTLAPVLVGDGTIIGPNAIVYEGVHIGKNCLIGDGAVIREGTRIGDSCVIGMYVTIGPCVTICRNSKVLDHCMIAGRTAIGQDCFIAQGVLTANDNDMGTDPNKLELLTIEHGCQIGMGAMLAAGVTIGHDSTIGAGALITRDIPPSSEVTTLPLKQIVKSKVPKCSQSSSLRSDAPPSIEPLNPSSPSSSRASWYLTTLKFLNLEREAG
jgi:acetyltransferase-like isoleucine patch superfamily enzyme